VFLKNIRPAENSGLSSGGFGARYFPVSGPVPGDEKKSCSGKPNNRSNSSFPSCLINQTNKCGEPHPRQRLLNQQELFPFREMGQFFYFLLKKIQFEWTSEPILMAPQ
jgi:hypothetical protein